MRKMSENARPEDCVFEEWGQWFDAGGHGNSETHADSCLGMPSMRFFDASTTCCKDAHRSTSVREAF